MQKPIFNSLRAARKNAGLLQLDVAKKLGFAGTDRISRWEKGSGCPHLVNLFKLSVLYGFYPHDLYPEFFREVQWQFGRPEEYQGTPLPKSLLDS
jgi:transcriptional regulator with XRE-family HTH domain